MMHAQDKIVCLFRLFILDRGSKKKILLYSFFCCLMFFMILETGSRTIRSIPLLILFSSSFFMKDFFHKKRNIFIYISLITIAASTIFHGMLEAKDLFVIFIGFISLSYWGNCIKFRVEYIYNFFLLVILPISITNYFTKGGVSYFPGADFTINIFGGNSTKHGTASVGALLFAAALYNIHFKRIFHRYDKKDFYFLVLALYFIFLSGSRSVSLSIISTVVLYAINYKCFRLWITVIFAIVSISSIFLLEELANYTSFFAKSRMLSEFVHTDNFERHGVTSGRSWLWKYHFNEFQESHYLGGGRKSVDFRVGDYIAHINEVAKAGSESSFTAYLACYGFIGVGIILLILSFLIYAIHKKNITGAAIMFMMIYNTLTGCDYTNPASTYNILLYMLYFSSFRLEQILQKRSCTLFQDHCCMGSLN